jgi:hypothetical protein
MSASMRNWLPKMSPATVRFSTLLTRPSEVPSGGLRELRLSDGAAL